MSFVHERKTKNYAIMVRTTRIQFCILITLMVSGLITMSNNALAQTAGTVTDNTGNDTAYACINSQPSVVHFDSSGVSADSFRYVITNDEDTIVGLPPADMGNFNPAGPGVCHVYGVGYSGSLNASTGMAISDVSAANGSDLSSNKISVLRDTVDGGTIETTAGEDTTYACVNQQQSVIDFQNNSVTRDENFQYVITDPQGNILGLPPSNSQNFNPAGPGECHVYGVAYLGDLMASSGMNISNISATECMDMSSNKLVVIRDTMVGGSVSTSNGEDTVKVVIDNQADNVLFMSSSQTDARNYQYIVTNAKDTIVGIPGGNTQNFNPAGVGECHVYGLAHLGDFSGSKGMHISDVSASECYELSSEYLVVNRVDTVTGIREQAPKTVNNITVYPNPATSRLNMDLSAIESGTAVIELVDLTGKQVLSEERDLQNGRNNLTLQLPSVAKGQYLLRIRTSKNAYHHKVVIH